MLANADTVPADVSLCMQDLPDTSTNEYAGGCAAPVGVDLSLCSDAEIGLGLERTGSSAGTESLLHSDYRVELGLGRSAVETKTGSSAGTESLFDTAYVHECLYDLNQREAEDLREQHTFNSSHWTSVVFGALDSQQKANLRRRRHIQYGDDCSGARAPYEALRQFVALLQRNCFPKVSIEDMFASECPGHDGDGPRTFINMQCRPNIMFASVHRGVSGYGLDLYTQTRVVIPTNVTVYTAGWVCRDVSTMSNSRKELVPGDHPTIENGKAGASSQTLDSSLHSWRILPTRRTS